MNKDITPEDSFSARVILRIGQEIPSISEVIPIHVSDNQTITVKGEMTLFTISTLARIMEEESVDQFLEDTLNEFGL